LHSAAPWRIGLVGAALLGLSAPALANPFEVYGAGARSAALGQSTVSRRSDWHALWDNPAAMAGSAAGMGAGPMFALDRVRIDLAPRPSGYDVPDLGANSPQIPSKYRQQPRTGQDDLPNLHDLVLGAVGSFGLPDLRVGVVVALPMTRLGMQRSHFADERAQYADNRLEFELLGARSQHQVIVTGLSYAALPWLSVGAALSVMPRGTAVADVYLDDPARQQDVQLAVDNEQVGRLAPIFGVRVAPGDLVRGGVTYRGANQFDLTIENRIQINGFQGDAKSFPVVQRVPLVLNATPEMVDVGLGIDLPGWHLAADAVWAR
jgi:hypothetical protein